MDLSVLIYFVIIVLVVFSQLKSMKKKSKGDSTVVGPDTEPASSDVDDILRQLLEQETIEPVYVEEQREVSAQLMVKKENCKPKPASDDTVKSSKSLPGLQNTHRSNKIAINSREELKRAILYAEIIRRKY